MQSYQPRTRLFVGDAPLHAGASIALGPEQAHYLRAVLRAEKGEQLEVFNGRDGAFAAQITALSKATAALDIGDQTAAQEVLPALTLAFAIVKKDRVQMIAEKATELGAARIAPIITARTQGQAVKQLKMEKLRSYIIEAAEQCGRTALPQLAPPTAFADLLPQVGAPDHLLYADEMTAGNPAPWPAPTGHTTLLIGPEGGFAPDERAALKAHTAAHPITLGPRILRAETAALAALALWQSQFGDW
jgi:16S rRNA (uracil1498-N3)-methyltransferase